MNGPSVPENVHVGDAIAHTGPWAFQLPVGVIILVSDAELELLSSDPDGDLDGDLELIDYSTAPDPRAFA